MTKPRPCGCKGCRTCLVCETQYGAGILKLQLELDKSKGYVFCPLCNKAWKGWDMDLYKQHPNHEGEPINYPGVYIQHDFLTVEEEIDLIKNIDEMPWDTSQSGRRKQNFGPKTNFKKKKVVPGNFEGFPEFSKFIQDRLETIDLLKGYEVIEQCSLEYDPSKGASIDPHIDDCWIWGERIVTVNCLSDSILTMTPYHGDSNKYNLFCAEEYHSVVGEDGLVKEQTETGQQAIEATRPAAERDIIVRLPMPRRSMMVIYGEPRYHWEHCVLREDITARRVCIAYREFTPPYLTHGPYHAIGNEIREKSKLFWDHREKYKTNEEIKSDLMSSGSNVVDPSSFLVLQSSSGIQIHPTIYRNDVAPFPALLPSSLMRFPHMMLDCEGRLPADDTTLNLAARVARFPLNIQRFLTEEMKESLRFFENSLTNDN